MTAETVNFKFLAEMTGSCCPKVSIAYLTSLHHLSYYFLTYIEYSKICSSLRFLLSSWSMSDSTIVVFIRAYQPTLICSVAKSVAPWISSNSLYLGNCLLSTLWLPEVFTCFFLKLLRLLSRLFEMIIYKVLTKMLYFKLEIQSN